MYTRIEPLTQWQFVLPKHHLPNLFASREERVNRRNNLSKLDKVTDFKFNKAVHALFFTDAFCIRCVLLSAWPTPHHIRPAGLTTITPSAYSLNSVVFLHSPYTLLIIAYGYIAWYNNIILYRLNWVAAANGTLCDGAGGRIRKRIPEHRHVCPAKPNLFIAATLRRGPPIRHEKAHTGSLHLYFIAGDRHLCLAAASATRLHP